MYGGRTLWADGGRECAHTFPVTFKDGSAHLNYRMYDSFFNLVKMVSALEKRSMRDVAKKILLL